VGDTNDGEVGLYAGDVGVKAGLTGENLGDAEYPGLALPIIGEVGLYPGEVGENPGETGLVLNGEEGEYPTPPGLRPPYGLMLLFPYPAVLYSVANPAGVAEPLL
jgi:hypothetical protein